MKWIIPAIAVTVAATLAAIHFPVYFLAFCLGAGVLAWLLKLGMWRATYALVILSTLGALSSVAVWSEIANYGRVAAIGLLVVVTYATTRGLPVQPLRGIKKWVAATLAALALIATTSALWSVSLADTVTQAALLISLLLVANRLATRRWVDRLTMLADLGVAVSIVSVAMFAGIVANLVGLLPPAYNGRFQGLFNNPNAAALVAVVTLFLGWGLLLERRSFSACLLLLPPLATIALAQSRTAFLALLVGVLWVALRAGVATFVKVAGVVVTVAILGLPFWLPVVSRFGVIAAGDAYAGRTLGWQTALDLLTLRPIGYGWGSTQAVFASAYQDGVSEFQPQSIHNSYLQVAFELGWLGFTVMALALVGVIVLVIRQKPTGVEVGLSAVVFAGLVMHFSESAMFGTGQPYPWIYWFAIAGLVATSRLKAVRAGSTRPAVTALSARPTR